MAKLPSSKGPDNTTKLNLLTPALQPEAPTAKRALDASEVGLPVPDDWFERQLTIDVEIDRLIVPAGTLVRGKIDHTRVARWIQDGPTQGYWAFEVVTRGNWTGWVRDNGKGIWSAIELA